MQQPSALGLTLCDQVIIDRDSANPSLIGMFIALVCSQFPSTPRPIEVFATLTDGQGRIGLDLVVTRLDTDELVTTRRMELEFANPLQIVYVRYGLRLLSFPAPGAYLFELQADGEAICHRRLTVNLREDLT